MEPRLRSYPRRLVEGFGKTGSSTAPGPGATAGSIRAATFARASWRPCSDPRRGSGGAAPIEPWHETIRHEADDPDVGVLPAIRAWSTPRSGGHPSEADRATPAHAHDPGYDPATALMARGRDGAPIAPALVEMTTAAGVLTARDHPPPADPPHIDRVLPAMRTVRVHLRALFRRDGLPERVLCDNGPPWGTAGSGQRYEALGLAVPASRYRASERSFPEALPVWEYGPTDAVRKVSCDGTINFRGRPFDLDKAFRGESVAVRPTVEDGLFGIDFGVHEVAQPDLRVQDRPS